MARSNRFEDLLTEGILAIQQVELKQGKKKIADIEDELGRTIGRQASTITWFRKGHIPQTEAELSGLASELYTRGKLDAGWVEAFICSTGRPDWQDILDRILPPEIRPGWPVYR